MREIKPEISAEEMERHAGVRITPHQFSVMMQLASKISKLFETCAVVRMSFAHIRLTLEVVLDAIRRMEELEREGEEP